MARSDLDLLRRTLVAVLGREGKSAEQGDSRRREMKEAAERGGGKWSVSKRNLDMKSKRFSDRLVVSQGFGPQSCKEKSGVLSYTC